MRLLRIPLNANYTIWVILHKVMVIITTMLDKDFQQEVLTIKHPIIKNRNNNIIIINGMILQNQVLKHREKNSSI